MQTNDDTMKSSTFVIAEAGVNHNGSVELALRLVETAAASGADAVKFQTFSADLLARRGAPKAEYQKRATGGGDQLSMLKSLELSAPLHHALAARCKALNIEFMSTAFDEQSLDFLVSLGIKRVKVPSGEITNFPLLRHMARTNLPLILSTGMATLDEVLAALQVITAGRAAAGLQRSLNDDISVLHCTSNYPALAADVNLRAMLTLRNATGAPVGYSDHTLGVAVSTAAVALGATIIEKHFTLDKTLPGPDHAASLNPDELKILVSTIREIEAAMGDGIKRPTQGELLVRDVVRRSATASREISAGTPIQKEHITLMRPGIGISPTELEQLYGRMAARSILAGETLTWADVV